jgi:protein-L-isoaspartate O-methyltransferase
MTTESSGYIDRATYSPDDNKIRLYPSARLPRDLYDRVKAAGFSWAPRQEIFVAPMWTPSREDLAVELAGQLDDEDQTLTERAEERAERFEGYQENRARDAEQAHRAVSAIADNIPLGQPILVGHHSEKRARKDAEKIENGMRRAVKMWDTAEYWKRRARGAIMHAKYKERPDVRARRIKKIEADKRKQERTLAECESSVRRWNRNREQIEAGTMVLTLNYALAVANVDRLQIWGDLKDGKITPEDARAKVLAARARMIAHAQRWIEHYDHRLAYERAMIEDAGGTATDKTGPQAGGGCRCWCSPGYGRGWSFIKKVNRVSVTVLDNWGNGGGNFTRTIPFDKLTAVMTRAEVDAARAAGRLHEIDNGLGFYIDEPAETRDEAKDRIHREAVAAAEERKAAPAATRETIDAMRESLRAGVQVVSAPQLFPTPPSVAARVIELADIQAGECVLEPSAGTGNLIAPIVGSVDTEILAYEINPALCAQLRAKFPSYRVQVREADFLTVTDFQGQYPKIVMNPPFKDGSDIKHIRHALTFLKPGGRLVAICANGPRQQAAFMDDADAWIELPAGTFDHTNVRAAIVVLRAPDTAQPPLPGAAHVRAIENPTPTFEAPFALTAPANRATDAAPRSLFDEMEG